MMAARGRGGELGGKTIVEGATLRRSDFWEEPEVKSFDSYTP
jgi:hypothetical protein